MLELLDELVESLICELELLVDSLIEELELLLLEELIEDCELSLPFLQPEIKK